MTDGGFRTKESQTQKQINRKPIISSTAHVIPRLDYGSQAQTPAGKHLGDANKVAPLVTDISALGVEA